jgi:hypothetical protein
MGNLKPGAKYIYERVDDTVYAREAGAHPSTRVAIGWDYNPANSSRSLRDVLSDPAMWADIRETATTNPALQKALDRVIMIYRLSKDKPL